MTKTLKLFIVSSVLLFTAFYSLGSKSIKFAIADSDCDDHKVKICHYNSSGNYTKNCVDKSSIIEKHDHRCRTEGHGDHGNDIIPSFSNDGCSFSAQGNQSILNNNCVVSAPTNTPQPTNTPRPTATNTPRPTATYCPTNTPRPTHTLVPTNTPHITTTPTQTNTPTPTETQSPTETPTDTPTPTNTPVDTPTPTETLTPTPTPGCATEYSCQQCIDYPEDDSSCNQNIHNYCTEYKGCGYGEDENWSCSCRPEPTSTLTPTFTPSPTPTQTPVPTATPTVTPAPTDSPVGGGDNGGSNPGAPVCNDAKPGTPSNLRVTRISSTQVRLDWDHAADPHTSYVVAYGPSIGNYQWGSPNAGNGNSYTVNSLTPGAQYCFYVRAQNNCMPGDKSNEVCINVGSTVKILGVTDNYNPLVDGIRESYGGDILGTTTELMATAEVVYSQNKLPSGNTLVNGQFISLPKLGINQPIYTPTRIGDDYTVGHQEVLHTQVDGSSVYYGHNGYDVFGGLYKTNIGDQVNTSNNGVDTGYKVTEKLFVHKSQVDSIKTSGDQIVLVTCSFTQPDYRIVIKASLTK